MAMEFRACVASAHVFSMLYRFTDTKRVLHWENMVAQIMWLLHFKVAEKAVGLESWDAVGDEAYPEIENMFPFDPLGKSS